MRLDDVHCRGFEGHQHRLTWLEAKFLFMMLRHGLRTAERIALRWHQVDLKAGYLDVPRAKRGHHAKHPLRGPQLRLLRELQRTYSEPAALRQ